MPRKRWIAATTALLLAFSLALTGCGGGKPAATGGGTAPAAPPEAQRSGGTLRVALSAQPPTMDWQFSTITATMIVASHVWETLTTFNTKFEVVPHLAESWQAGGDGKEWTFKLRKGVPFHNGKEMKAEDVVASVKRWTQVSGRKGDLKDLEDASAVDEYTVRFKLKSPLGGLPAILGAPSAAVAIMPKDVAESSPSGKLSAVVGTGPYRFVEFIPDRHVKVERFDKYSPSPLPTDGLAGARKAYVDAILFTPVPETATRLAGIEAGDYDFAEQLPNAEHERLSKSSNVVLAQLKPYWWLVTFFNKKKPPFDNKKARQAVLAALDMEEIMKTAAENPFFYRLNPSLWQKEQIWYNEGGAKLSNQKNAERARQLLKEAGYNGQEIVMLTTRDYESFYKASLVVKKQLEALGVKVKLDVYDWPTVVKRRTDPALYDMFFTSVGVQYDALQVNQQLLSASKYPGWYESPAMDALLTKGMQASDLKERQTIYTQVQELFYEDVPFIKFGDYFGMHGLSKRLKGFQVTTFPTFWGVWLEKK